MTAISTPDEAGKLNAPLDESAVIAQTGHVLDLLRQFISMDLDKPSDNDTAAQVITQFFLERTKLLKAPIQSPKHALVSLVCCLDNVEMLENIDDEAIEDGRVRILAVETAIALGHLIEFIETHHNITRAALGLLPNAQRLH